MATEYKCDICGKPAMVHITKIIDDKKVKVHLCADCAKKASIDPVSIPIDIFPKLQELENQVKKLANKNVDGICPTCGANLAEIEKGGKFSCPDCYEALSNKLFEILAQIHASTTHKGKKPTQHLSNSFVLIDYSKKLRDFDEISPESAFESELEDVLDDIVANNLSEKPQDPKDNSLLLDEDFNLDTSDPENKLMSLQVQLDLAISQERYEDAAKIRDQIESISDEEEND